MNSILAVLAVADIVLVIAFLAVGNTGAAPITFLSLLGLLAIVWQFVPRRYELWLDRLSIVFPVRRWEIPYESIEAVRAGRWYEAFGFAGSRFVTAQSQAVTVVRRDANLFTHPNIVISPEDREVFLRELARAMGSSL